MRLKWHREMFAFGKQHKANRSNSSFIKEEERKKRKKTKKSLSIIFLSVKKKSAESLAMAVHAFEHLLRIFLYVIINVVYEYSSLCWMV